MKLRLFLLLFTVTLFGDSTTALYLSWYDDPTTTITIQWHSTSPEETLQFQDQTITPSTIPFPDEDLTIHTVKLNNLIPNTTYTFQIDGTEYTFQTAPADLKKPLRFIIGGDLYRSPKLFRKMCETASSLDPLFAVLGGDLAYALNASPFASASKQWRRFLSEWKELMVAPNNRLIPFLVVSGNHDITPDNYELFFSLFAYPTRQLYRAVDFGSYLTLFLLDTDHFQPIQGRQTIWLEKTLASHLKTPYLFAIYHEGAYPSHYDSQGTIPIKIRTHWCPLFDRYHLQAAFENHSHAFKRTYPLKGNKIDPTGTLYFGDGCWGAPPRNTHNHWYLQTRARKNNIYLLELNPTSATVQAIGLTGELLEETKILPR